MSARSIRNKKKQDATKMYRHFAVVTVAATAVLAMFADGENRQSLKENMEAAAKPAPHNDHLGEAKLVRRDPHATTPGSFGSDSASYGAPMDQAGSQIDSSGVDFDSSDLPPASVPSSYNTEYGVPEDVLAKLTPEQKEDLLKRIKKARFGENAEQRQEQIARLKAASQARAGAPSEDGE